MNDQRIIVGQGDPLPFWIIDSADHITGAIGLTLSPQISKNAGVFAAPDPASSVAEMGFGSYQLSGGTGNTDTIGPVFLYVPGTDTTDPALRLYEVVLSYGSPPLALNSTTYPMVFLLVQSDDHVSALTGADPTVLIRKVGSTYSAPVGAVNEIGYGLYSVGPSPLDYDVAGPLLLHAEAAGADPTDVLFQVVGLPVPIGYTSFTSLGARLGVNPVQSVGCGLVDVASLRGTATVPDTDFSGSTGQAL